MQRLRLVTLGALLISACSVGEPCEDLPADAAARRADSITRWPRRPRSAARPDAGRASGQSCHLCAKAVAAPGALLLSVRPDGHQVRWVGFQ